MSIFKVQLDEALARLATPPTRRHGGTRLRSSIALQSPIELLHTESKVLPESDQGGRAAGDGRGILVSPVLAGEVGGLARHN